jgi:CRP/FNR family cyclic AMP-dependent transcriptional regulator
MIDTATLRQIPLMASLDDTELNVLRPKLRVRELRKHSVVLREGTPGEEMYLLASGTVRVYRVGSNGKEITLAHLHPGDIFGEIAVLSGTPRSANVIARTRSIVLELTKHDFEAHARRFPGLSLALAQSLAERVRLTSGQASDIALFDVPQRLLRALKNMAEKDSATKTWLITDRPTHQELADFVGTSREVVSRCLKVLEQDGHIAVKGRALYFPHL